MTQEYKLLLQKLDKFIKKYYKNRIIKGIILFLIIFVLSYSVLAVSEYIGHFTTKIRTAVFYLSISLYLLVFTYYIIIPILKFIKIGKTLNYKQAAEIISKYFSNIEDKLLNTIELAQEGNQKFFSNDLLIASIDQKISQLKPIPFHKAIKLKDNLKYFRYLLVILFISLCIYLYSPQIFTQSTARIINHNQYYAPPAPYKFILTNDSLNVQQGKDLELNLKIEGKYIPEEVTINYGGNAFLMKPKDARQKTLFTYKFHNINNPLKIFFSAEENRSKNYEIKILPSPTIINFSLNIIPPAYTGENKKTIENTGDLTIPEGSVVQWSFDTKDIEKLSLIFNDSTYTQAQKKENRFELEKKLYKTTIYKLSAENKYFKQKNVLKYTANVIADLYPSITMEQIQDSANLSLFYFRGNIKDDYGTKKLTFNYMIKGEEKKRKQINIPINKNIRAQEYFYMFDFKDIETKEEQEIVYYFEVSDNDAVNGNKKTKTNSLIFKIPTKEEIDRQTEQKQDKIEEEIDKGTKLAKQIQEKIAEIQKSNIDKNKTNWEKSQMIKDIMKMHKELEDIVQNVNKENKLKNKIEDLNTEKQKDILEKQKKLEELLEKMMTDEIKKLMQELEKLQEKFNENQFNNIAEKMQMDYEDLEKQLDKNLELLKKFEIEKDLKEMQKAVKELSEKEKELQKETSKIKPNKEEIIEKQDELKQKLEDLEKKYQKLQEKNKELRNPLQMDELKKETEDIKKEMQKANENLKKNNKRQAKQNQENAQKKLNELSTKMMDMIEKNFSKKNAENAKNLRQILDNLIIFSFRQEELMQNLKKINYRNPKFADIINRQRKQKDNFSIIKDSLNALASRTVEIGTAVNKDVIDIRTNLDKINKYLDKNIVSTTRQKQQMVMTSANNLALLLAEALKNMNNSGAGSGDGDPNQQQEKQGEGKMPGLRQQQQSLKQQLEQMIQQMKEGKKGKQISKKLSQMLSQQEMMQKALQDLKNSSGTSNKTKKKLEEINQMIEDVMKDIVNKNLNQNTIRRQEQIIKKFLEAEKAEREQETEKKRKAEKANKIKRKSPQDIFKNKKQKDILKENLNKKNLKLNNFYKNKYEEYLQKLAEEQK